MSIPATDIHDSAGEVLAIEKRFAKPFSSPGGKDVWASWIVSNIPDHRVYTEIYAGSASVFWLKEPSEVEVLSDKDPAIVHMFKFIKRASDAEFAWLRDQDWSWSERRFETVKNSKPQGAKERVFRFKYLNLHSVRGVGTHIDRSSVARDRQNPGRVFLASLEKFRDRLKRTHVLHADALEVFKRFDGRQTFHYVDPPWKPVGAGEVWRNFDEDAFVAAMQKARGKVLLSYQGDLPLKGWTKFSKTLAQGGFAGDSTQQIYANYPGVKKAYREISREFLEEIWNEAKRHLPGWVYASLRHQAMSRAGGRARHRLSTPTHLEAIALRQINRSALEGLADDAVEQIWDRCRRWYDALARQQQPVDQVVNAAACVLEECRQRALAVDDCALSDAVSKQLSSPLLSGTAKDSCELDAANHAVDVATTGPGDARLLFVSAAPSPIDKARNEPLVGRSGEIFNRHYLAPLGFTRDAIAITHVVPKMLIDGLGRAREPSTVEVEQWNPWLVEQVSRFNGSIVVALGKTAKQALGDRAHFVLPHPVAVHRSGNDAEVCRKLKQIRRALERKSCCPDDGCNDEAGEGNDELLIKQSLSLAAQTRGTAAFEAWEKTWHDQLPRSGKGRFVYQHHWRGLRDDADGVNETTLDEQALFETDHSLHGDLRFEGDDRAWGFSVLLGSAADNKAAAGDKLLALESKSSLPLVNKLPHSKEWLEVGERGPAVIAPGEAGATSSTYGKIFAVDSGTYELGVAHQHAVEIFLDGKDLRGRYLLQLAPVDGRKAWLITKPADQTPAAQKRDLADLISELRRQRQRFLIWSKPDSAPQKIDIRTGKVVKRGPVVSIAKADPVKRIVFGVVLDPYGNNGAQEDAHRDWNPPAEIEKTAHNFLKKSRVVGLQHTRKANAEVVESSIEQYPSRHDYLKAMRNEPHRVFRRKFGSDVVHSGAWILGVELGPVEWSAYERGELNAFSPGGFGFRAPIARAQLPAVTFVDLIEKPSSR